MENKINLKMEVFIVNSALKVLITVLLSVCSDFSNISDYKKNWWRIWWLFNGNILILLFFIKNQTEESNLKYRRLAKLILLQESYILVFIEEIIFCSRIVFYKNRLNSWKLMLWSGGGGDFSSSFLDNKKTKWGRLTYRSNPIFHCLCSSRQ